MLIDDFQIKRLQNQLRVALLLKNTFLITLIDCSR